MLQLQPAGHIIEEARLSQLLLPWLLLIAPVLLAGPGISCIQAEPFSCCCFLLRNVLQVLLSVFLLLFSRDNEGGHHWLHIWKEETQREGDGVKREKGKAREEGKRWGGAQGRGRNREKVQRAQESRGNREGEEEGGDVRAGMEDRKRKGDRGRGQGRQERGGRCRG